jgi:4-aminobutyrate aminotransferase-like enzyme
LEEGFIVGHYPAGNLLRLTPSLTIPESDIDAFVKTLDALLIKAETS